MQRYRTSPLSMVATKPINMPALSSTMKEGKIVSWSKKVGDKVSSGDVLLVVESDKADMDVESYEDGYLAAIYTPEGGTAVVGAAVAVLVDSIGDIANVGKSATVASAPAPPATAPGSGPTLSITEGIAQIMMPALSSTMKEGKIVSWSKKVGDKVSSGDVLLVVESDKADMDVESYEDGYLASILVPDGASATVGAPVALLAKTVADIPKVQAAASIKAGGTGSVSAASVSSPPQPAASSATTTGSTVSHSSSPAVVRVPGQRVAASGYARRVASEQGIDLSAVVSSRADGLVTSRDLVNAAKGVVSGTAEPGKTSWVPAPDTINATPTARKLAADNGLDIKNIKGTGNFNRVTKEDVLKAAGKWVPEPSPAVPVAIAVAVAPAKTSPTKAASDSKEAVILDGLVPMDGMQKAVAKNMEATLSVPVFRVSREIFTDDFDSLYAELKPKGVTVSSLLAKAVTEVLRKHPIVNAAYVEGGIKYSKDINVAMAVAIDGGLITPTIVKAQDQDLFQMSKVWKQLVDKAKNKKLAPAEYNSGTFFISNLGMFGVSQFGALLPSGAGSILAISAALPKVVQLKNGFFGVRKAMTVTITCDHRHIYGADAAEFLKDLADLLENNPRRSVE